MSFSGWLYGGSVGLSGDHWMSWKKHVDGVEVNMLICKHDKYIEDWLTAAEVCRFLHLRGIKLTAGTRHGIHEIIMDDADADSQVPLRGY